MPALASSLPAAQTQQTKETAPSGREVALVRRREQSGESSCAGSRQRTVQHSLRIDGAGCGSLCTRQARAAPQPAGGGGESIRRRAAVSGHFYIKQIFLPN